MNSIELISRNPEAALGTLGGIAGLSFAALANRVLNPHTMLHDIQMRSRIPSYGRNTKKAAVQFGNLGKEWAVVPLAAMLGGKLWLDDRREGGVAVLVATLAGIAASHLFDATLPQRTPPPGRRAPMDPHFPSGHALHSSTLLLTTAYVLAREGAADTRLIAAGTAAVGVALGIDRLMQDRHWTSDVVGGWLAAVSIAALTAACYETVKRNSSRKGKPRRRVRKTGAAKPQSSRSGS